ncbi:hypothetical protein HPB47_011970 [Ixodes persulcatus]|uniref:Uncharacterized protein n=1 Tax=Ixodes persulcatus TaxID=34615 RepID=A0AC60NUS3_IXOPE|nr:hypothetical protein HPB47_011970 [Ixodes persulcatus]
MARSITAENEEFSHRIFEALRRSSDDSDSTAASSDRKVFFLPYEFSPILRNAKEKPRQPEVPLLSQEKEQVLLTLGCQTLIPGKPEKQLVFETAGCQTHDDPAGRHLGAKPRSLEQWAGIREPQQPRQ